MGGGETGKVPSSQGKIGVPADRNETFLGISEKGGLHRGGDVRPAQPRGTLRQGKSAVCSVKKSYKESRCGTTSRGGKQAARCEVSKKSSDQREDPLSEDVGSTAHPNRKNERGP